MILRGFLFSRDHKNSVFCRFAAEVLEYTGEKRKRIGSGYSLIRFLPLPHSSHVAWKETLLPCAAALDCDQRRDKFHEAVSHR